MTDVSQQSNCIEAKNKKLSSDATNVKKEAINAQNKQIRMPFNELLVYSEKIYLSFNNSFAMLCIKY